MLITRRSWVRPPCGPDISFSHINSLPFLGIWNYIYWNPKTFCIRRKVLNGRHLCPARIGWFQQVRNRGCSSVVERSLRMWKAPGSIPGISMGIMFSCKTMLTTWIQVEVSFLPEYKLHWKLVPQVRLELTTSASLSETSTVYKYGALTDCATGANGKEKKGHDWRKLSYDFTHKLSFLHQPQKF